MYSTVASLVAAAKHQLNDETNGAERFSPADLTRYAMEGQLEIFKLLPHLRAGRFSQLVNNLSHEQTIPTQCDFLIDVAYIEVQIEREVPLQRGDYKLFRSYVGVGQSDGNQSFVNRQNLVPRRWYYDPSNPGVFYIEPLRPFASSRLVLTCLRKPSSMIIDFQTDLPPDIVSRSNTLIDYIMMRAYEVDTESATSMERQKIHREQFYRSIKMDYEASASINSRFYLGRKGDQGGDPRAA